MASKSSDHTRPNSVRDSDRACARKSNKHKKALEDDIHPHEGSRPESPLSAEESGSAEDEELLEMLEQLSKTIDTAHNVIAGQQALSSSGVLSEEARASQEQVSGLEHPLPPPVAPARRRVLVPVLASAFSLSLASRRWLPYGFSGIHLSGPAKLIWQKNRIALPPPLSRARMRQMS